MKAIIRMIEKNSIKKGDDMGKPYYTLICTVGPMHRLEEIKVVVIPNGAESTKKMVVDYYEGLIAKATADAAAGQPANLGEIQVRRYIVGDRSVNPNTELLPPYHVKDRKGEFTATVHTSMGVWVELDEEGNPVQSPYAKALRIIDQICKRAEIATEAPTLSAPDPLAGS